MLKGSRMHFQSRESRAEEKSSPISNNTQNRSLQKVAAQHQQRCHATRETNEEQPPLRCSCNLQSDKREASSSVCDSASHTFFYEYTTIPLNLIKRIKKRLLERVRISRYKRKPILPSPILPHCLKITQKVSFEFCHFGIFHQFMS